MLGKIAARGLLGLLAHPERLLAWHFDRRMERGRRLHDEGRFGDARRAFEGAVTVGELAFGQESLSVARALGALQSTLVRGRIRAHAMSLTTQETLEIGARGVAIHEHAYGPDDRRLHHVLEHHAMSLEGMGRDSEALAMYARAVDLAHPLEGGDCILLLSFSGALARAGHISEALDVVERIRALPGFGATMDATALTTVEAWCPRNCPNAERTLALLLPMLDREGVERWCVLVSYARTLRRLGRHDDAAAAAEVAYAEMERRGARFELAELRAWMAVEP